MHDLHRREGDLWEGAEDFHANVSGWCCLMDLATAGGWEPAGTVMAGDDGQPDPGWHGGYGTNDGQYVTPEDATALADAVDRGKVGTAVYRDHPAFVDRFVAYCRGGGFEIW